MLTRSDLERLQVLLQRKIAKLSAIQHKSAETCEDLALTEAILLFIEHQVSAQLAATFYTYHNPVPLSPVASAVTAPNVTWTTSTGPIVGKPSTICDNCWYNSGCKHSHCTHMMDLSGV